MLDDWLGVRKEEEVPLVPVPAGCLGLGRGLDWMPFRIFRALLVAIRRDCSWAIRL